jgi:sec-independent protein translocase protein TatB
MFDVGFSEILVIFVLALIVLGPERLPKVAAQVGKILGRARAMARQFKDQLEEEITLEERKKTEAKAIKPIEMPPPAQDATPQPPEVQAAAAGTAAVGVAGAAGENAIEGGPAHAGGRDESAQPGYQATGADPTVGETGLQPSTTPWVAETSHDMASHEAVVEMESGHVDLTHEAWPHAAPVPPPEVAAVFGDQLMPAEPHVDSPPPPKDAPTSQAPAQETHGEPGAVKTDNHDSPPAKDSSSQ